jgi:hypothetical protein
MNRMGVCVFSLVLLWIAGTPSPSPGQAAPSHAENGSRRPSDSGTVQVAMKNVVYHFSEPVTVHIIHLQGTLTPTRPGAMVVFDDKNSFILNLASAEITISCNSLAEVMNQNVFGAADAPIKNVTIASKENQLIVKGELHSQHGVPFELSGTLAVNGDGRIRLHAERVKAAHLPVKGLLDLLGVDLANLINTRKVQGVFVDKDDLILDPQEILPPPHIRGKVTTVRLQGNEIVQVFGTAQRSNFAAEETGNYMAYRDSDLRFGRLIMDQADLTLLDMDPQDPFDFYLDHYKEQLVAGYTKTTPEFGLRVYTRDYNKLRKHAADNRYH